MLGRHPDLKNDLDRIALIAFGNYTSTQTGTAVDMSGRVGVGIVKLKAGDIINGTSPTLDVEIQDSADNSTFATAQDIDGNDLDFTQVDGSNTAAVRDQELFMSLDGERRYVRALATIANAQSGTVVFGVELIVVPKDLPGSKS